MKKYKFKGILLALGLVFATLSMQAGADYPKYCCEIVDINKVVASYTGDTTFEIYIKAKENLHFWDVTWLGVNYKKLIKNNGHYVPVKITLHDDDGTGTDEFKMVVSGLDFGSRIFFSWVDLLAMGKAVFKNYDYGTRRFERIEFERTSDFNNGTSGGDNTGWNNLDAAIDVIESGSRWDKQKLVVDAAKSEVLSSLAIITKNIDADVSIATKWNNLSVFKAKIEIHKKEFEKLARPHITAAITTAHETIINNAIIDHQEYAYKSAKFMIKLEGFWHSQHSKTNKAYESAKAVKEQREQDNSPTATLQVVVAEYLKEINFLKTLEHTDTEKNKVIEHQANYSALKEALYVAMAGDSKVRNNIFAIAKTHSEGDITMQTVVFTPKLTSGWRYYTINIDNVSHSVEVLAGMSVDQILQAFSVKFSAHPTVYCLISFYENFLCVARQENVSFDYSATAREATQAEKDAAEVLWQPQLALTKAALLVASYAYLLADEFVYKASANVEVKAAKVEASKQANAAFLSEITALDAVKKTEAHASIITTFNNSHQMLQTQTSDLDAIVKKVFADAEAHRKTQFWQHSLGVANAALATATSAEVDANNAVNGDGSFASKAAAITVLKEANVAFNVAIQTLITVANSFKKDEADAVVIAEFNNQLQTLQRQASALEATLVAAIEAKRATDLAASWLTQLALTNTALTTASNAVIEASSVLASTVDFPAKTAAIEASKQANEAFRLAIQALDTVKRDQDDGVTVTTFNDQHQALKTQITELEVALAAAIEAKRAADLAAPWLAQLALTNTAFTTASNAVIEANSVLASTVDFPAKTAAIEASKQANEAFRLAIQALDTVKRDQDDGVTVTTFNDQHQALKTQITELEVALAAAIEAKRVADLAAPWLAQLALTNTAFTTASNAAIEANSVLASTVDFPAKTAAIEASKQANEAFKVEIQALDAVKRDQDDGVIVTTFNNQHQALQTQITELEVALAAAIEAKRVADLAAPWQAQLALTDSALITANTVVSNAASVMNSDAELSSKTTAVEASKQANAVFISAIQALKLVERDATDGAVTTAFNDQYQTLLTQTTALEATLAMAIEAKRVADLAAPWLAQLALTNAALTAANEAMNNARFEMETDAELSSKTTVVEASKQANAVFISAIQALKLVERDATDGAVTTAFTAQHQTLLEQNNALEATLAASEEKRVFDEATLTGYWKFPVIKGLNYQTTTHPSGITDETGAFKCQPGEVVAFSIENLSLTQVDCQAVLQAKTTKSISLSATSTGDGFKDWQDEQGKQVIITKVLFGLFNDNIKTAFAQADEALKFITVKLTEVQKGNTANQSLDANDLSVMVQNVLGTTESVVLPTTEQATNMVTSGWQANKVFDAVDTVDTKGKADTKDKADTEDKADTDASKKSSGGGGCVYNPNATGRADVGFILLMVLSVYYLVRRKRLTT